MKIEKEKKKKKKKKKLKHTKLKFSVWIATTTIQFQ